MTPKVVLRSLRVNKSRAISSTDVVVTQDVILYRITDEIDEPNKKKVEMVLIWGFRVPA